MKNLNLSLNQPTTTILSIFLFITGVNLSLIAQEKTASPEKAKASTATQARSTTLVTDNPFTGKTFSVVTVEEGKTESEKDILTFDKGMNFQSVACRKYGFTKGPFKYSNLGNSHTFEATTTSPEEGKMVWKGTLNADKISGTAVWHKNGQKDINYTFKGTALPKVDRESLKESKEKESRQEAKPANGQE